MIGLTKRQREMIDYIKEFMVVHHYSPSYREIATHFGFSSLGSVYKHVGVLKRKGLLENIGKMKRSLTPTEKTPQEGMRAAVDIPLIGTIVAGAPIQMFSQSQHFSVAKEMVAEPENTYALRVDGDSFFEEKIADGDILLVETRFQVDVGRTVVALVNAHDTLVKKYYPEGDYVRFVGVHEHHHPIIVRQEDVLVQGVVIALIRSF